MRKFRFGIVVVSAAALLLLIIAWVGNSGEAWTFRVVDRKTGMPISNVTVVACYRWTTLQFEKLHLPSAIAWQERKAVYRKNQIRIPIRKLVPGSMSLKFSAAGYEDAYFHQFKDPPCYGKVIYAGRIDSPRKWVLDQGVVLIELEQDR
jgi:hypothetical protein